MNVSRNILIGLLAGLVVILSGCGEDKPQPQRKVHPRIEGERIVFPADGNPPSLTKAQVQTRDGRVSQVPGRLVWDEDRTVRIYSPFAGRVVRILAQPGTQVTSGQTLAAIESPEFGMAQTEFQKAAADLALRRKKLERVRLLQEHGVAARKELDEAQAEYVEAESELERSRSRLKLYGNPTQSVDQHFMLRSPLAGEVVQKNINPGQELLAEHSEMPLFLVSDPTSLWALLDAGEADLSGVKPGQSLALIVHQYPEERFPGVIAHVADYVDPVTRTVKILVHVPNDERRLKAEMYVTGEIPVDSEPKPMVPFKSLVFLGGRYFVFVAEGDNTYVRREIKPGAEEQGMTPVLAGLGAGESVVVEGALYLQQLLQSAAQRP